MLLLTGWLWWLATERFPWDAAATQTTEGNQEETSEEDPRYVQEDQQGRLWEVLEGVQYKVSFICDPVLLVNYNTFINVLLSVIWNTNILECYNHTW